MENDDLTTFALMYADELYPLAYNLTLDQQKAFSLTYETLEFYCRENAHRIISLAQQIGFDKSVLLDLFGLCLKLYKNIPSQAPVKGRLSELGGITRGLLYLKHKRAFSYNDLNKVFDMATPEIIANVHKARDFLLQGREDLC